MFLEELIEGMSDSIALVGNGFIRDKGEMIDEFDNVIRFNHFPVDVKYATDVGKKTDYWCINRKIGKHVKRINEIKVPIIMVRKYSEKARKGIEDLFQKEIIVPKRNLAIKKIVKDLQGKLTTGFRLILYFVNAEKRITLFGFDGLQTGHYWNLKHKHCGKHGKSEYDFLASHELIRIEE